MKKNDNIKPVTIVIPCRNEKKFISKVLDNVLEQDYPSDKLEVIVVDGDSDDGTAGIIKNYSEKYSQIKYLNNPQKIVPFALNKAIKKATGDIIVRMDAHSEYPLNYISKLAEGLENYDCENIGGVWITEPTNSSIKAKAIAVATSHPFGIGNAHYRLGVEKPRQVDTVPFGCYRKEVFDMIGLFDEELARNQDDEFNARLIKNNGKIFLLPDVKIRYFARESFTKTAKMFYQYGLYKPLVNLKVGQPATLRQFAPPALVLFIIVFGIGSFFSKIVFFTFIAGLLTYGVTDVIVSALVTVKNNKGVTFFVYLKYIFPLIHISYGWGYLKGIFRFYIFRKKIHHSKIKINR